MSTSLTTFRRWRFRWPKRLLAIEQVEPRRLLAGIEISAQEQLLLELVNRARANPTAEVARFGIDLNKDLPANTITATAKQPLAPNQSLANAARAHSNDMIVRDYFAHVNLSNIGPGARISAAGYTGRGWGENIVWSGSEDPINSLDYVYKNHELLVRSATHRTNIMKDSFDELGPGIVVGVFTQGGKNYNSSMLTEDFGTSQNLIFLTGVAYSDRVQADRFYTVGEGLGGLTVTAKAADGTQYQTQTGSSGGYSLPVPAGTYSVTFSGGSLAQPIVYPNVVVVDANVKVDLNTARTANLSLTVVSNTIAENAGTVTATLKRTGFITEALTVSLTSSQAAVARVPTSVTFAAGADTVTFAVAIVDDTLVEENALATLTAMASGSSAAALQLTVTDNDLLALSINMATSTVSEGARQVSASVSRGSALRTPTTVSLTSSDTSAVTVPTSVVIPAGNTTMQFTITIIDDSVLDGSQISRIAATAPGATGTNVVMTIMDNETGTVWTNPQDSLDVNGDGSISALDSLLIINRLNQGRAGQLPDTYDESGEYLDVNGDAFLSPLDALMVINRLNRSGGGEGEWTSDPTSVSAVDQAFAEETGVAWHGRRKLSQLQFR